MNKDYPPGNKKTQEELDREELRLLIEANDASIKAIDDAKKEALKLSSEPLNSTTQEEETSAPLNSEVEDEEDNEKEKELTNSEVEKFVEDLDLKDLLGAEFYDLAPEKQLKVVQDLKRRIVDLVKADAETQYSADLKKKSWLKKIEAFGYKQRNLVDYENKVFAEIGHTHKEIIEKDLKVLIEKTKNQKVYLENGKPKVGYVTYGEIFGNETNPRDEKEEKRRVEALAGTNKIINTFIELPYEWGQEEKGAHRKKYDKAKKEYDEVKEQILNIKSAKEISELLNIKQLALDRDLTPEEKDTASNVARYQVMLEISQMDSAIQMEQLLNTHPEYEQMLADFEKKAEGRELKRTLKTLKDAPGFSRTNIAAGATGAGLRYGTKAALGLISTTASVTGMAVAAPLIGGLAGYWRGKVRAIKAIQKGKIEARHQEWVKEKYVDEAGNIQERKFAHREDSAENKKKIAKLEEKIKKLDPEGVHKTINFSRDEKTGKIIGVKSKNGEEVMVMGVERLIKIGTILDEINNIKNEKENTVNAEALAKRLEDLINAYNKNASTEREDQIKRRIEFTQGKIEAGLVNFGDAKSSLINQYNLITKLNEAIAISVSLEESTRKDISERLEKFLANKTEKITKAQESYIKKQAQKGMYMGAGFASGGYGIKWLFENIHYDGRHLEHGWHGFSFGKTDIEEIEIKLKHNHEVEEELRKQIEEIKKQIHGHPGKASLVPHEKTNPFVLNAADKPETPAEKLAKLEAKYNALIQDDSKLLNQKGVLQKQNTSEPKNKTVEKVPKKDEPKTGLLKKAEEFLEKHHFLRSDAEIATLKKLKTIDPFIVDYKELTENGQKISIETFDDGRIFKIYPDGHFAEINKLGKIIPGNKGLIYKDKAEILGIKLKTQEIPGLNYSSTATPSNTPAVDLPKTPGAGTVVITQHEGTPNKPDVGVNKPHAIGPKVGEKVAERTTPPLSAPQAPHIVVPPETSGAPVLNLDNFKPEAHILSADENGTLAIEHLKAQILNQYRGDLSHAPESVRHFWSTRNTDLTAEIQKLNEEISLGLPKDSKLIINKEGNLMLLRGDEPNGMAETIRVESDHYEAQAPKPNDSAVVEPKAPKTPPQLDPSEEPTKLDSEHYYKLDLDHPDKKPEMIISNEETAHARVSKPLNSFDEQKTQIEVDKAGNHLDKEDLDSKQREENWHKFAEEQTKKDELSGFKETKTDVTEARERVERSYGARGVGGTATLKNTMTEDHIGNTPRGYKGVGGRVFENGMAQHDLDVAISNGQGVGVGGTVNEGVYNENGYYGNNDMQPRGLFRRPIPRVHNEDSAITKFISKQDKIFAQNILPGKPLTTFELKEVFETHEKNLHEIFQGTNIEKAATWEGIKKSNASELFTLAQHPGAENVKKFGKMFAYLNKIKEVTKLEPNPGALFRSPEDMDHFIARALQTAEKMHRLKDLKLN